MFVAVDIIGIKSKSEGLIIKKAIDDCITSLFPDSNEVIEINVEVAKNKDVGDNTYALVDEEDDGCYTIFLSQQALEDDVTLYKTICHECAHIKQYFTKELIHVNQYRSMFRNKVYDHFVTSYNERPWEVEAFEIEEEMYKCFENNQQ